FLDFARNDKAPKLRALNLNRPFEDKFRGTSKRNTAKLIVVLFKSDVKFVSAPRNYRNRPIRLFDNREDECACDYPSAACERFVFHAAFISPDSNFVWPAFLDEVYVCAFWRKHFVIAKG